MGLSGRNPKGRGPLSRISALLVTYLPRVNLAPRALNCEKVTRGDATFGCTHASGYKAQCAGHSFRYGQALQRSRWAFWAQPEGPRAIFPHFRVARHLFAMSKLRSSRLELRKNDLRRRHVYF